MQPSKLILSWKDAVAKGTSFIDRPLDFYAMSGWLAGYEHEKAAGTAVERGVFVGQSRVPALLYERGRDVTISFKYIWGRAEDMQHWLLRNIRKELVWYDWLRKTCILPICSLIIEQKRKKQKFDNG